MNKKPHGHYCRICGQRKANEKFSGRGHAAHICKACAKRGNKPPEIEFEPPVIIVGDDLDEYGLLPIEDIDRLPFSDSEEPPKPKKKKRKPSKDKLLRAAQKKTAKAFLSKLLADGEVSAAAIREAAGKSGIPTEALHRAKGSLGIRAFPTENGSVWRLPTQPKQAQGAQPTPE